MKERAYEADARWQAFLTKYGWAPGPGGAIYEDYEGPVPSSEVPGAAIPATDAGWASLAAEADRRQWTAADEREQRLFEAERVIRAGRVVRAALRSRRFERAYVASGPHFD